MTVTFKNCAAQGDILIRRIKKLPADVKPISSDGERFIVAHSETGHNHVIAERQNVKMYTTGDPMVNYIEVVEVTDAAETLIEHLRSFDTHESIAIPAGVFEIRRQREYTPEGWRRVED